VNDGPVISVRRLQALTSAAALAVLFVAVYASFTVAMAQCSTIQNFDGYSYGFIARSWATGRGWAGVNAYWSPLYPAIAVLFVRSGHSVPESLGLANVAGLLVNALLIAWLARREGVEAPAALLVVGLSLTLLSRYCLMSTPDVWSAAATLVMVLCFRIDRSKSTPASWMALAGSVSLGYLTKLHLIGFGAILLGLGLHTRWRNGDIAAGADVARYGAATLAGVLPLLLWAGCLTVKYHRATLGDTGRMAARWYFGLSEFGADTHYLVPAREIPSVWFDPMRYRLADFGPDPSVMGARHQVSRLSENAGAVLTMIGACSVGLAFRMGMAWSRTERPSLEGLAGAALPLLGYLSLLMIATEPQARFFGALWSLGLVFAMRRGEDNLQGPGGIVLCLAFALTLGSSYAALSESRRESAATSRHVRALDGWARAIDRSGVGRAPLFATDDLEAAGRWPMVRGWRLVWLPVNVNWRPDIDNRYDAEMIRRLNGRQVRYLALSDPIHVARLKPWLRASGWRPLGTGLWENASTTADNGRPENDSVADHRDGGGGRTWSRSRARSSPGPSTSASRRLNISRAAT
jgi:hypothetical protein